MFEALGVCGPVVLVWRYRRWVRRWIGLIVEFLHWGFGREFWSMMNEVVSDYLVLDNVWCNRSQVLSEYGDCI